LVLLQQYFVMLLKNIFNMKIALLSITQSQYRSNILFHFA